MKFYMVAITFPLKSLCRETIVILTQIDIGMSFYLQEKHASRLPKKCFDYTATNVIISFDKTKFFFIKKAYPAVEISISGIRH